MAKVFYSPSCDAELLSAYRDAALDAGRLRNLEVHLEACPTCRQELLQFERFSVALQRLPVQPRPRPPSRTFQWQRPAPQRPRRPLHAAGVVAGASLAALLFVASFQRLPPQPSTLFAAYPPSGASDVSTDTSIVITFPGPVDQTQVQRTLRLEPQVPFDVAWDSAQRAEVIPLLPLDASTTYTLLAALPSPAATIAPPHASPGMTLDAPPQTLTVFHTAPLTAVSGGPPPVLSRRELLRQRQVADASQAVLAVPATPSPVGLPSAAGSTSRGTSHPTLAAPRTSADASVPAPITPQNAPTTASAALADSLERPALLPPCAPANVFTPVYSSRGDVRSVLGCVVGPARAATLVSQEFQRGLLLAVLPDNTLYELTADGIWSAAPLSKTGRSVAVTGTDRTIGPAFLSYWQAHAVLQRRLGLPIAPQTRSEGLVQRFAHGLMLSTSGWLYIADDAGQWQRMVSLLPGAAGTPVASGAITGGVPSFPPLRRAMAPTVTPAARQLAVAAASPGETEATAR